MKIIYTLLFTIACVFGIYAQPADNASEPPVRETGDVLGIYGDAYSTIAGINYDPNWGQSGHTLVNPDFDPGTGNTILAYPNFNYQGTDFAATPINAASMENLHVDIWVPLGTDRIVKVSPIDDSGVGASEILVEVPIVPGSWNSVDLPKSDFADMSWNSIIQMKFDGQFNSDGSANTNPFDIYVDNIYFWREAVDIEADATLSDLQVDGVTVPGFSAGQLEYNINLPVTTTDIPVVSATPAVPDASVGITQATAVPGTAEVSVTSADGTVVQNYVLNFSFEAPFSGAPDPTDDEENVISLFSDSYTDVSVDTWNTEWSDATFEDIDVDGNPTKLYTSLGFNGIETTTTPVDASEMTILNMSVWSPDMEVLNVKLVDFLGDGFEGANGDTEAEISVPVTQGEWMSVQIPLSDFTNNGMTSLADINQFIIGSQPFGSGTLYLDNVYFSKIVIATPMTSAPDPTDAESDVISLFSDSYTDVNVDTWNTEWSDASFEDVMVDGNPTKLYTSLGFNGIESTSSPVDASEMMFINMDVWSPNMDILNVKLVDFLGDGFEGANGDTEAELSIPVTQNEWMSLRIPLSDFSDAGMTAFSDLNQYILSSEPFGTGTLFVDNVYFSRMSTSTNDITDENRAKVFPNPVSQGEVLNLSEEMSNISIISLQGQILQTTSGNQIKLNRIAAGTYLLKLVKEDGKEQVSKIMVY